MLGVVGVGPAEVRLARLQQAWAQMLPSRVRAWPVGLRGDVLQVVAETAAWAQELSLLAPRLLGRLRERVPDVPVGSLRVRVGPLPRRPSGRRPRPRRELAPAPIPPELEARLRAIEDEELRSTLREAVGIGLAAERARRRR